MRDRCYEYDCHSCLHSKRRCSALLALVANVKSVNVHDHQAFIALGFWIYRTGGHRTCRQAWAAVGLGMPHTDTIAAHEAASNTANCTRAKLCLHRNSYARMQGVDNLMMPDSAGTQAMQLLSKLDIKGSIAVRACKARSFPEIPKPRRPFGVMNWRC